ncbi:hypothetical protein M9Q43_09035 [Flavobacterium sp. HXWNR29]|uniref:hypothetical protein n=1 Tax=Flavobacterium odoriferum TaxID=2946604 RepID=UPI0021CB510D|nr:hypothetical protein [Flavobacterium sp. HXWNR29]MCU4189307.1 hypothetical protein [Flavobacterium sp. HXWNR29]
MNYKSPWFALLLLSIILIISNLFDFPFFAYFIVICILAPFLFIFWIFKVKPKIDENKNLVEKKKNISAIRSRFEPTIKLISDDLKNINHNDFEIVDRNKEIHIKKYLDEEFSGYSFFELSKELNFIKICMTEKFGHFHFSIILLTTNSDSNVILLNEIAKKIKLEITKSDYYISRFKYRSVIVSTHLIKVSNSSNEIYGKLLKIYTHNPTKSNLDSINKFIESI